MAKARLAVERRSGLKISGARMKGIAMTMLERTLSCLGPHGFHRLHYIEWLGPKGAPVVLCTHGLTRNSRDFDALAQSLADRYHVVCPDYPGRGKSEWLCHPEDYGYPLYLSDLAALIARLDVETVNWVGTSMGGLTGMMMAAQPGTPIRRLVINDIGPFVPKSALEMLRTYVVLDPNFSDVAEAEAHLRCTHSGFGPMADLWWRHMARHAIREKPDGRLGFSYDPRIGDALRGEISDVDLWEVWDRIDCPTLLLRGAESAFLRAGDAEAMTRRGPKAKLVEFAGIGHAPSLTMPDQIEVVRQFLDAG